VDLALFLPGPLLATLRGATLGAGRLRARRLASRIVPT